VTADVRVVVVLKAVLGLAAEEAAEEVLADAEPVMEEAVRVRW
jgi:hypothetical protein